MKKLILAILLTAIPALAVKPVQIVTKNLPNGENGVAYSQTLRAKFGTKPYTWTLPAGSLPTGLSLNAGTGAITGTPTVNNTFTFTVRVTDSAGSPTVDNRTLSITIAGTAPVTAVKIGNGSLATGVVGTAYSDNLQADGGTAPYVWTVDAGFLAPGLSLSASTGAITGTPTADGLFTPTFKVTDAGSQTDKRGLLQTVNPEASPTYLFEDGFEAGCTVASCTGATAALTLPYFPAWSSVICASGVNCATDQTAVKHDGSYAYEQRYVICDDSTDPTCGSAHQDINRYLRKTLDSAPTTLYMAGWLYLKSPEVGGTKNGVQRKLMWTQAANQEWSAFLALDSVSDTNRLRFSTNGSACGVTAASVTFGESVLWDGWHHIELRMTLNTPGASDGVAGVYVDGVQVGSNSTNRNMRGSCTTGIEHFRLGTQADRNNYNPIDEYRYWDTVILNTSYIGP